MTTKTIASLITVKESKLSVWERNALNLEFGGDDLIEVTYNNVMNQFDRLEEVSRRWLRDDEELRTELREIVAWADSIDNIWESDEDFSSERVCEMLRDIQSC